MKHRHRVGWICTFGVVAAWGIVATVRAQVPGANGNFAAFDKARLAEGRKLFRRDWLRQGRLNATGDGLGPMYNAVACAACHNQKGIGGGGADEHNVELLSLARKDLAGRGKKGLQFINQARKDVHPGFAVGATWLILHKHGPAGPFKNLKDRDYVAFRKRILGEKTIDRHGRKVTIRLLSRERPSRRIGRVPVRYSQRNTPALFGAGLIDSIPESVLLQEAERQRKGKSRTGISGRVARTGSGKVGRFGWRGDTATLHDFVLSACANELGLEVRGHRQAASPDDPQPAAKPFVIQQAVDEKRFDLTDEQCRSITAFVADLPAPVRAKNLPPQNAKAAAEGEKLFAAVRCALCHKPDLGPVRGFYSDLLLHEMGRRLSDPAPAASWSRRPMVAAFSGKRRELYPGQKMYEEAFRRFMPQAFDRQGRFFGVGNYVPLGQAAADIEREWRTPPLWGVADSAPYLHDGRAGTLEQAIAWHGGEAAGSLRLYKRLQPAQRKQLIAFLQTLVAPAAAN